MVDSMLQKNGRNVHEPIETLDQDLLGRHVLAQTILNRLCNSDSSIFGIYGGWGTGKTSLLNLLDKLNDERLEAHQSSLYIKVIDAWKYEMTGSLFLPVIVALKKFAQNEAISGVTTTRYLKRLGKVALLGASDIVLRKLGLSLEDAKSLMNDAKEVSAEGISYLDWETLVDDVENTRDAFKELVKVALKGLSKNKYPTERIVFCIDNLDRCSPENAISLLESVKNFLTVPGCIWVFAVDSDVIASYIDKKYEGTAVNGYGFLDKIIPEQYHLSLSPSAEDREIILNLIYLATGNRLTLDDPGRLPQVPRAIVPRRLIKSAQKFFEFFEKTPFDSSHDTVFALILLYHSWPDFYELLSSPSANHIGCILANFFRDKEKVWDGYEPLPLSERFTADQELMYFLRQSFPTYRDVSLVNHSSLVNEIRLAMDGLRRTGLP